MPKKQDSNGFPFSLTSGDALLMAFSRAEMSWPAGGT